MHTFSCGWPSFFLSYLMRISLLFFLLKDLRALYHYWSEHNVTFSCCSACLCQEEKFPYVILRKHNRGTGNWDPDISISKLEPWMFQLLELFRSEYLALSLCISQDLGCLFWSEEKSHYSILRIFLIQLSWYLVRDFYFYAIMYTHTHIHTHMYGEILFPNSIDTDPNPNLK